MQQSLLPDSRQNSQRNLLLFVFMVMTFLMMQSYFRPEPVPQVNEKGEEGTVLKTESDSVPMIGDKTDVGVGEETESVANHELAPLKEADIAPTWVTLGSLDPQSPYRMLVTLANSGASVLRIELNEHQYREVQDFTGYLGQIVADLSILNGTNEKLEIGCPVQVLGPGTPAERAGIQLGDRIVGMEGPKGNVEIRSFDDLRSALLATTPLDQVVLTVHRDQETLTIPVQLGHSPLNIVRPIGTITTYQEYNALSGLHGYSAGWDDQLSYLCTLSQIDDMELPLPKSFSDPEPQVGVVPRDLSLNEELKGVNMRRGLWELVRSSEDEAVFRMILPTWRLEVTKTFRLAKKDEQDSPDSQLPNGAYHLVVGISVKNLDNKPHKVAYSFDGPTGMPLEGGWYPRKTGPGWGSYGIRDIVVKFEHGPNETIANNVVAYDRFNREPWKGDRLDYIGVDSQYFQSSMIPRGEKEGEIWQSQTFPIRVGAHDIAWSTLTDISFRTKSTVQQLGPGISLEREYTIFAGPKKPDVLAVYGLQNSISYGWFWFVAIPMLMFLHFIKNNLVFHYGLAIIVLTICVRLLMYPLSRKQAINAAKNAALMPEMQKLKEKHKGDLEAQSKAQQELWKRHNFNPLSGCLGLFIQLPIFIGLYKSLSIDVELYGAPLISKSIRWCNDLSAPDQLFGWSHFWESFGWNWFNTGQGVFALGPFFNVLPILTVILFLVQQAIMMPPPTDDQSRAQRKIMQYMMLFMGLLFFKVPSGLCVYFIASSLWGLAEKQLIPKYEFNFSDGEGHSGEAAKSSAVSKPSKLSKPSYVKPTMREEEPKSGLAKWWKKVKTQASERNMLPKGQSGNKKKKKK